MLYINLRRTDKTTKALRIASAMGVPLMVSNTDKARIIERMSRDLRLPVRVLIANEMLIDYNRHGEKPTLIIIDDVNAVLRNLFGVEVLLATSTGEIARIDIKPKKLPYERTRYVSKLTRKVVKMLGQKVTKICCRQENQKQDYEDMRLQLNDIRLRIMEIEKIYIQNINDIQYCKKNIAAIINNKPTREEQ